MENNVAPVSPPNQPTPPTPAKLVTPTNYLKILLFIFLGLIIVAGTFITGIQIGKGQVAPQETTQQPTTAPEPSAGTTNQWKTIKFGVASFEYPAGWHVAEIWQGSIQEQGILVAIDPNPISTAPRGGPLATFEIRFFNGNKNPDEILAKKIGDFNESNYSDITKETISADIGEVFYYKGKMTGEMYKGKPVEKYFFTYNKNPNDLINQQVVVASLTFEDDPQLSATLRHIILSFKETGP